MALSYRICFAFIAFVSVIARWASHVGDIFVRAVQAVFVDAFPAEAPHLPTAAAEETPLVIGLSRSRAYEARRLQRSDREVSVGRGLCLAA